MAKPLAKKGIERERRKRSRSASPQASKSKKRSTKAARPKNQEVCHHCNKNLVHEDRALLVEEEKGRVFCGEECIAAFFGPEIERLEKEYFRLMAPGELPVEEREKLAHLRWITLEEPDEVWREKTLSGDYRYTLISEFCPADRPLWCVCICLFLRGEPSFLFLAFPTQSPGMVDHYRKGERVQWAKRKESQSQPTQEGAASPQQSPVIDGLAEAWTEDETLRAELNKKRRDDDIPNSEYGLYEACLEQTLEAPGEVWTMDPQGEDGLKIYHFIRHYPEEEPGIWFIIVSRETDDEEQIEILDAFPTRDPELVDRYRRGTQEIGTADVAESSRLVH